MLRRFLKLLAIPVAAIALIAAAVAIQINTGNFYPVIEGELYRSAQPEGDDLAEYVKKAGIKSVINLRGGNENDAWYQNEIKASKELGLTHINFRMKAARELTDAQIRELLTLMKNAPKPVLIHCNAGADRSGLAAALYMHGIAKQSDKVARRELSLFYGHVPLWWLETQAMDRTYERYISRQTLAQQP